MNKTLIITTIVLVAVIMGISAVAPMIPQAFAGDGEDHPEDCESGSSAATKKVKEVAPIEIIVPC